MRAGADVKYNQTECFYVSIYMGRTMPGTVDDDRPRSDDMPHLMELVARRQQLVAMREEEERRKRSAATKTVNSGIDQTIRVLTRLIAEIDDELNRKWAFTGALDYA